MEQSAEYGKHLAAELSGTLNAITRIHIEWEAGNLVPADLRDLLPLVWTRESTDSPEAAIGTAACVRLFRSTGFIAVPNYLKKPARVLTIYRGATESHRVGMAWTESEQVARDFRNGKRRRLRIETFVFQATAHPEAVLALFADRPERELVVDPSLISDVRRVPDPGEDSGVR